MKYFLMLIIMAMGYGAYYEYGVYDDQHDADQKKISDLSDKLDPLQKENDKLTDEKTKLAKSVADDEAKIADLNKQVQDAQTALDATKTQVAQMNKAANPDKPAAPSLPSNNLGTIATLDGKSYANCQLLKVKEDGIVITFDGGITQLAFLLLPPALQKRFGFDPHVAPTLTDAQVQTQEAQRVAASQVAGN